MKRRPTTPDELFEDMGYSPLDWPGRTTRLRRDSVQDVRQRLASTNVALGELYHENSKLYPARCDELAASRLDPDDVRLAFLRRRAESKRPTSSPDAERFAGIRPLLSVTTRLGRTPLFYALELRVADDTLVARHEPLMDTLVILKTNALGEYASLRRDRQVLSSTSPSPSVLLFIVASFVRNEVLFGARGYRRTLIEAGQLAEIITMEANRLQIPVCPVLEFHDRRIDGFIEVDGIEQGTVLILEVGGQL
jgi:hypothetical protein